MRYVIFSDIHSNLEAFSACLEDYKERSKPRDVKVNLGDLVGYGPDPEKVMDLALDFFDFHIIGNHDLSVFSYKQQGFTDEDMRSMNPLARLAISANSDLLSDRNHSRLSNLIKSAKYSVRKDNLIFAHSNPFHPRSMQCYIREFSDALAYFFSLKSSAGKFAFVGHFHVPQIYTFSGGVRKIKLPIGDGKTRLPTASSHHDLSHCNSALIVVPGAGQPRDQDTRTGYLVFDTETKQLEIRRIEYDFRTTQEKIMDLGFIDFFYERLAMGK